jgi:hypothetical protein
MRIWGFGRVQGLGFRAYCETFFALSIYPPFWKDGYLHNEHSFRAKFAVVSKMQVNHKHGAWVLQKLYSDVNVEIASRLARPTRSSGATVSYCGTNARSVRVWFAVFPELHKTGIGWMGGVAHKEARIHIRGFFLYKQCACFQHQYRCILSDTKTQFKS